MAPNDTKPLPPESLYESIDRTFLEVWETCRPFYALSSSPNFSIENIPPRLDDALQPLQRGDMMGQMVSTVTLSKQPVDSTETSVDDNKTGENGTTQVHPGSPTDQLG